MTRTWSDRRLGLRSAPRFSTPFDGRLFTERDGRLMLAWPWNAKTTRRADRAWVRARAHPLNCAMRAIGYARAPVLPEALAYLTPSAFRARRSVLSAILSAVASLSTSVAGRSPYANAARRNSIASVSAALHGQPEVQQAVPWALKQEEPDEQSASDEHGPMTHVAVFTHSSVLSGSCLTQAPLHALPQWVSNCEHVGKVVVVAVPVVVVLLVLLVVVLGLGHCAWTKLTHATSNTAIPSIRCIMVSPLLGRRRAEHPRVARLHRPRPEV